MGTVVSFPTGNSISPFKGASTSEAFGRNWITFTGTADQQILSDLPTLRERSRYLCNNDIAGGIIENIVTSVIGTGLKLDISLDHELLGISKAEALAWRRETMRRFQVWAGSTDPDLENKRSFYGIQRNAFRSMLVDGDAFALLTNLERMGSISSLRINTLDPAKVKSDFSNSGIVKDKNGMPVQIVVHGESGVRKLDIYHPLGLRNIVHSFVDKMVGQSRGLPFIQGIISRLRKLEKYSDAELGAAVITSMLVLAFKKAPKDGGDLPSGLADLFAGGTSKTDSVRDLKITEGTQIDLEHGEEIQDIKSDRPNSGYGAFVDALWREIAMALNIPYEVLVKAFGRSYSASRGAMHEAYKFYMSLREIFATEFVQPIYERWLFEEVAEGRIIARGYLHDPFLRRLWSSARWIGPPKGTLDENKEAQAAKTRIEAKISTREREIAQGDGGNIDDVHNQLMREKEMDKELEDNDAHVSDK